MDMVWGNNKAAADNDMAPVRGSRLCLHGRKDRTRGKPPFQMLVPFTLFLYARYGVRTTGKKRRRLSSGIFFYTFTSIECPAVGCWDGSIFTVSSAAACACCMTVFVKAIFTFCARDAWCIAIDNAGISIASTSLSLHIGGVLRL